MKDNIHIKEVSFGSDEYQSMLDLRDKVLRQPLGLRFNPDILATEDRHIHLALYLDDKMAATLILNEPDGDRIKMRQVAVLPEFQGKGLGKMIVEAGEEKARALGMKDIYCHARDTAVPFYKSLDYEIEGDQFIEIGIPHYRMHRLLK